MADDNNDTTRKLALTLDPKGNSYDLLLARVHGKIVLSGKGSAKLTETVDIPNARSHVEIHVIGTPGAKWALTVDLPGKVNDFTQDFKLTTTHQEVEFDV